MSVIFFVISDLLDYSMKGLLFVWMLAGALKMTPFKAGILWSFHVLNLFLLSYFEPLRVLLYGEGQNMISSRQSIAGLLLGALLCMAISGVLFRRSIRTACYLTITYFAFGELVRLFLFVIGTAFLSIITNSMLQVFENGRITLDNYIQRLELINMLWVLGINAVQWFLLFILIKKQKRYLFSEEEFPKQWEYLFLLIPSVVSLCISILLRGNLFAYEQGEIILLVDKNPETAFLIPFSSVLCALSILLSTSLLKGLKKEQEEKSRMLIYKNRMQDMEIHIRDIEKLYDGIRGMKHDLKNYTADLALLLNEGEAVGAEYISGIYKTLEQLDMKYPTGNPVTDVVVNRKLQEAVEKNIGVTCNFIFPKNLGIEAFDLSIILNNALDNAIEACLKEVDKKEIWLESYQRQNMFFVVIKNTCSEEQKLKQVYGNLITTKSKEEEHGFGIKNISQCADKYFGKVEWERKLDFFILTIMLQEKLFDDKNMAVHDKPIQFRKS